MGLGVLTAVALAEPSLWAGPFPPLLYQKSQGQLETLGSALWGSMATQGFNPLLLFLQSLEAK